MPNWADIPQFCFMWRNEGVYSSLQNFHSVCAHTHVPTYLLTWTKGFRETPEGRRAVSNNIGIRRKEQEMVVNKVAPGNKKKTSSHENTEVSQQHLRGEKRGKHLVALWGWMMGWQ